MYGILRETQYSDEQIRGPQVLVVEGGFVYKEETRGYFGEAGNETVLCPDGGGSYTNLHMC